MNKLAVDKVVEILKKVRGKTVKEIKDLPEMPKNEDNSLNGVYAEEKLIDPGIQHEITGSGNGPIIRA